MKENKRYKWEVLALLWIAFFLNQADRQVFNVVLPLIKADLHIIDLQIGSIATAFDTTLDEYDFIDFLCSETLVGSLESVGSIPRIGRKNVKIVMGSREEILGQILCFSKAAKVRSILRQSTLGLLANYYEAMWSTYIDPYNLFELVGPELRFITYTAMAEEINYVADNETKTYKAELESKYPVMDDVDDSKFYASVRGSFGLAKLTERSGIDIMLFNDINVAMFKMIGYRPCFIPKPMNA